MQAASIIYLRGVVNSAFLIDATGWFGPDIGVWDNSSMRAQVDWQASQGINLIRVVINMNWFTENTKWCKGYNIASDRGFRDCLIDYINYCQTKGMYVLISPWQIQGETSTSSQSGMETAPWVSGLSPSRTQTEFLTWWDSVATTFQNNTNLLIDPWNEPHPSGSFSYDTWMSTLQTLIPSVRSIMPHVLVFVQWGYSGDVSWASREWNWLGLLGNVVVKQHIYRSTTFESLPKFNFFSPNF